MCLRLRKVMEVRLGRLFREKRGGRVVSWGIWKEGMEGGGVLC